MTLTVIGTDKKINGHFLPNLFAIKPNITEPKKTPMDQIEIIHEASSLVSWPLANGVFSLRSNNSFGLAHPPTMPYWPACSDTMNQI